MTQTRRTYRFFRCGICGEVADLTDAHTFDCTLCRRRIKLMCRPCWRRLMFDQGARCGACHDDRQEPLMGLRYTT